MVSIIFFCSCASTGTITKVYYDKDHKLVQKEVKDNGGNGKWLGAIIGTVVGFSIIALATGPEGFKDFPDFQNNLNHGWIVLLTALGTLIGYKIGDKIDENGSLF